MSRKRDDIMVDIYEKAEVSIEELRSKVNDLSALKELFKDLSDNQTSSLMEKFKGTDIGDILSSAEDTGDKIKNIHTALDQLKKVSKDIEVTQKGTNASYVETLKILKDIYQSKQQSKNLTEETKRALEGQISALKIHESQHNKLHEQKRKQFEEEKSWAAQLSQIVQRRFGENFGSSTISAALGRPQGGLLDSLTSALGQKSGFADTFRESTFVKMLAKGFDASDNSTRMVRNTAETNKHLSDDDIDISPSKSSDISKGVATALLTTVAAASAARYTGGKGLEGANWAIQGIKGFSDPGGLDKFLYGQIGGKLASGLFGNKAGQAVTGIAGTLIDALTFTHKLALDSSIASAGIRAQSGDPNQTLSLQHVAQGTGLSSGEARGLVDFYTRQGVDMSRGGIYNNIRKFGHTERFMGADVAQTGFGAAYRGLTDSNEAAEKLYRTFVNIRGLTNNIGFSVQDMTKQIASAAAGARFLQWDFSVISKLAENLIGDKGDLELMKLGLDPKQNMGNILSGLTGIRKSPLGVELYHSRNMGFNNINEAMRGAAFGVGPEAASKIYYDEQGFAVNPLTEREQRKAGSSYNLRLLQEGQKTLLGLSEEAKDFVQRDDAFARKLGLGSADTAKVLLNSITGKNIADMDPAEIEKLTKDMLGSNKTSQDHLADISKYTQSSAAYTEKFQMNTMSLLKNILNAIILIPGYMSNLFNSKEREAYSEAFSKIGDAAIADFDRIFEGSKEAKTGLIMPRTSKNKQLSARDRARKQTEFLNSLDSRGGVPLKQEDLPPGMRLVDPPSDNKKALIKGDGGFFSDFGSFASTMVNKQKNIAQSHLNDVSVASNKQGIQVIFNIENSLVDLDKISSLWGSIAARGLV